MPSKIPATALEKSAYIRNFIIDMIFPPTAEELALRGLSPEQFLARARKAPPAAFSYIIPLLAYKDPLVAELIWQIKAKKNHHAFAVGAQVMHSVLHRIAEPGCILVPIPISKQRRRERGYNQCELLIDGILKLDNAGLFVKNLSILKRTKHVKTKQAFKNRQERLADSHALFSAEAIPALLNSPILIIDDVVTTGSTAKEARDALLAAGYSNVRILALSH